MAEGAGGRPAEATTRKQRAQRQEARRRRVRMWMPTRAQHCRCGARLLLLLPLHSLACLPQRPGRSGCQCSTQERGAPRAAPAAARGPHTSEGLPGPIRQQGQPQRPSRRWPGTRVRTRPSRRCSTGGAAPHLPGCSPSQCGLWRVHGAARGRGAPPPTADTPATTPPAARPGAPQRARGAAEAGLREPPTKARRPAARPSRRGTARRGPATAAGAGAQTQCGLPAPAGQRRLAPQGWSGWEAGSAALPPRGLLRGPRRAWGGRA